MKKIFLLFILFCLPLQVFAQASAKFISYSEVGKGQPLVLIHAFPTDKNLYAAQQEGLKSHFRVITLDLWGFGQSESVDGRAIPMTEYASEVKQLLDYLHIPSAIIGGESMGGYIALSFLKQFPASVDGLILSNTQAIADSEEAKAKREATAKEVLEQGSAHFIAGFMQKVLSEHASASMREYVKALMSKQSVFAIASALRGMALREDTSAVLSQARVPILIITSDLDTAVDPKQSAAMHALAPRSELVVLKDTGHLSNIEQPQAWNKAVIAMFIKGSR